MKCRICGVEYNDTDRFCGICGTPNPIFEVKPVVSPETTPTSDNPDKINELYDTAETVSAAETADNDKSDDNDKSVEANQAKEDAVSRRSRFRRRFGNTNLLHRSKYSRRNARRGHGRRGKLRSNGKQRGYGGMEDKRRV